MSSANSVSYGGEKVHPLFWSTGSLRTPVAGTVSARLSTRSLVHVDLPGHGMSTDVRANLWKTAQLLTTSCGTADYIGYSLGGRVLLHAALAHPDKVTRAVLIGATAGIEDSRARKERVMADELLARQFDATAGDPEAFEQLIRRWLAGPLFKTLPERAERIAQRMQNDPTGLASSLRLCGTGTQDPLWDRVADLQMPVLVLAGALDDRFSALGQRLAQSIGDNAQFEAVPGAGHACHLEKPVETAEIIEEFLKEGSR
jgi:2-succinyl-6-hydroxy-2,4-cyclohexadiene-1-carboxylate synthase